MSEIIADQLRAVSFKMRQAQEAASNREYAKSIQYLNEAGVLILAVAVSIQKLMARD